MRRYPVRASGVGDSSLETEHVVPHIGHSSPVTHFVITFKLNACGLSEHLLVH